MCSNLHMSETSRRSPADTYRPDCHRIHGPATRVVEWREPDPHSTDGEHYGPFHLLCCHRDSCAADAVEQAFTAGGVLVEVRHADTDELTAICAQATP